MSRIQKKLIGDTMKVTWVSSAAIPSSVILSIFTGSESLVSSASMTNSGAGHYYGLYICPNSPGFYVAETLATISGNPYKDRLRFKIVKGEADG